MCARSVGLSFCRFAQTISRRCARVSAVTMPWTRCGALARGGDDAHDGIMFLTSRVSIEMVQKSAAINAPVMVAMSAPTALAIRTAEDAGITLAAVARDDGFEVFTHGERIADAP